LEPEGFLFGVSLSGQQPYLVPEHPPIGFLGPGCGPGLGTGFIIQLVPGGSILGVLLSGQQPYLVPLQPPIFCCCIFLTIGQLLPSKLTLELTPSGQHPYLVLVQLASFEVVILVVVIEVELLTTEVLFNIIKINKIIPKTIIIIYFSIYYNKINKIIMIFIKFK
jgi:hypothetical protein